MASLLPLLFLNAVASWCRCRCHRHCFAMPWSQCSSFLGTLPPLLLLFYLFLPLPPPLLLPSSSSSTASSSSSRRGEGGMDNKCWYDHSANEQQPPSSPSSFDLSTSFYSPSLNWLMATIPSILIDKIRFQNWMESTLNHQNGLIFSSKIG